jgi:zinc-ribbon domain
MADCPNCGAQVEESVRLCPNCGFDTGEAQAAEVRALREQGKIHPGRLHPEGQADFRGGDPTEVPPYDEELPAEDTPITDPRQIDGGM